MKYGITTKVLTSLALVLVAWQTPASANPKPDSFAAQCAPGLQTTDPGRPPDTMPGQVLQECREQFAAGVAANDKAPATQFATAEPSTCPVTSHDIVVDNIADLRLAAATAAPGSVIGIDGMIDINSDGGQDVMVSVPGVTVTCASDDAGLTGFSDPGAGAAVLWIQADDVTVRYLNVDASFGRGILFGDRFFSGAISANNGLAEYNRLSCTITCLFFWDVNGGIGRHNVVGPALANFGLVALFGQNVTFSDNMVSNCAGGCVLFQEHLNGNAIGNTVEQCGGSCLQAFFVSNVSFLNNKSPQCNVPGMFVDCVRIQFYDQAVVEGNEMHKAKEFDGSYGFSIVVADAEGPGLRINHNTTTGGFHLFNRTEQAIVENNHMRDCGDFDACLTGFENTDLTVRDNALFAEDPGLEESFGLGIQLFGISGEILIARNIVHGAFRSGMVINAESLGDPLPPAILSVRQNDLRFAGGILASGIKMDGINNSIIEKNHIELFTAGTDSTGIELSGTVFSVQFFVDGVLVDENERFNPVRNNIVRNNRVIGAETGLLLNAACDNHFFGNNFQLNGTGALFELQNYGNEIFEDPPGTINEFIFAGGGTGGNDFRGNSGIVVEEVRFGGTVNGDGYLDCDGDGTTDPNTYSGQGPM
ncbi:MAG: right-handed parallel beta-helix repeat-containing protein [Chromatiales bacterium]|nr:right-handed parallel beta-helix repeat-containing protein [Chromatiales bacterium]MDH3893027.1 right-handed parallel beta-helix repeat-containing protein [Chromatiales bacterium]